MDITYTFTMINGFILRVKNPSSTGNIFSTIFCLFPSKNLIPDVKSLDFNISTPVLVMQVGYRRREGNKSCREMPSIKTSAAVYQVFGSGKPSVLYFIFLYLILFSAR